MTTIKITKMNGCGNDFVIIDKSEFDKANLSMSDMAKKICDRNFGVGGDGMIIPNWLYTTILSYQKWSIIISLNYRGEESILTFDEKSFIDIFGVIYYTPYIISILDILNDGMDSISVRVNLKSSVLRFDNIDFILSSKDEIDPYHYRGSTFKLYEEIKAEIAGRLYL